MVTRILTQSIAILWLGWLHSFFILVASVPNRRSVSPKRSKTRDHRVVETIPVPLKKSEPIYAFTAIPDASFIESSLRLMLFPALGDAVLSGYLRPCTSARALEDIIAQKSVPYSMLSRGECNFVFFSQKQSVVMRKIRKIFGPDTKVYTFTMLEEPAVRAAILISTSKQNHPVECPTGMPTPICQHGLNAFTLGACAPVKTCWSRVVPPSMCGSGVNGEGPIFGEIAKYLFSDDCSEQDGTSLLDDDPSAALTSAFTTLASFDVVGLSSAFDASFCQLFWLWGFRDVFDQWCRGKRQAPEVECTPPSSDVGAHHAELFNATELDWYRQALPAETELYARGVNEFRRRMELVENESGALFPVPQLPGPQLGREEAPPRERKGLEGALAVSPRESRAPFAWDGVNPVYVFTHVPRAAGLNTLGAMVFPELTAFRPLLKNYLTPCSPPRSAFGRGRHPYERLKRGECNFVFASQKHASTVRLVRQAVGPSTPLYTFTVLREPVARAASLLTSGVALFAPRPGAPGAPHAPPPWETVVPPPCEFRFSPRASRSSRISGSTSGEAKCAPWVPAPICESGLDALGAAACDELATKCWCPVKTIPPPPPLPSPPPPSSSSSSSSSPPLCRSGDVGAGGDGQQPLFGEIMKFYFSGECEDQARRSSSNTNASAPLSSALATLSEIDVVGLSEAYEETMCALFWFWKLRDPFHDFCRPGKRFPAKFRRSRFGLSTTTPPSPSVESAPLSLYRAAIAEELELYNRSRALFWERMELVGAAAPPPDKAAPGPAAAAATPPENVSKPETKLHFMRIAKTASTSLLLDMDLAADANASACRNLVAHREHEFVAEELLLSSSSPELGLNATASFAVLREPCDRFLSVYRHLRKFLPDEDPIHGTGSAAEWGELLLNSTALRSSFLHTPGSTDALYHHRVSWQQSAYVVDGWTEVACFPTVGRDAQQILARHLPGCRLPARLRRTNAAAAAHGASGLAATDDDRLSPRLCRIAGALYPEDIELWRKHCLGVGRIENPTRLRG